MRTSSMSVRSIASLILFASFALGGCAAGAAEDETTAASESAMTTLAAVGDGATLPKERLVNGHAIEDRVLKARLASLDADRASAAARYRAPLVNEQVSPFAQPNALPVAGEVDVDQPLGANLNPRRVVTFGATLIEADAFVDDEMTPRYALAR